MDNRTASFVAVNFITCIESYQERFEELFATRKHAIDTLPGFIHMHVIKQHEEVGKYMVVSYWENEEGFRQWLTSEAFIEGHTRGFKDIKDARERGEPVPMKSEFRTYSIIAH
jgi:heme oxygenase (mycobilin-producing)